MRGLGARIRTNLAWVVVFSIVVVIGAFLTYVGGILFTDEYPLTVAMPEAGGVLPGMEVTLLGRAVGTIENVTVVAEGVQLDLRIDHPHEVPAEAVVQVLRRSPIGEQTVDFQPVSSPWTPAEEGATIDPVEAVIPAEVPFLLEEARQLFAALEVEDVATLVHELAAAVGGRGQTLRELNRDALDLNRTLVSGIPEFERLLDSSEVILATLHAQRFELADFITNSADLTAVLADQNPTLERLLDVGTRALDQTDALIRNSRADLSCIVDDFGDLNAMLSGPSTAPPTLDHHYDSKLDELEQGLIRNRWFFRYGFDLLSPWSPPTGAAWSQILLDTHGEQGGQPYAQKRPTPPTLPGAACDTEAWGTGVNAVGAPGRPQDRTDPSSFQPPDPTSPGILWAEVVAPRGGDDVTPPDRAPLPATGGGLAVTAVLAPALMAAALVLRRRR